MLCAYGLLKNVNKYPILYYIDCLLLNANVIQTCTNDDGDIYFVFFVEIELHKLYTTTWMTNIQQNTTNTLYCIFGSPLHSKNPTECALFAFQQHYKHDTIPNIYEWNVLHENREEGEQRERKKKPNYDFIYRIDANRLTSSRWCSKWRIASYPGRIVQPCTCGFYIFIITVLYIPV